MHVHPMTRLSESCGPLADFLLDVLGPTGSSPLPIMKIRVGPAINHQLRGAVEAR